MFGRLARLVSVIPTRSSRHGLVSIRCFTDANGVKVAELEKRTPGDGKQSRVVVVTSGKGGVGKTTTSASFSTGLAQLGFKVCVIDFDIGLRNLDLHLALIKDKRIPTLSLLAASQTRDKSVLTEESVGKVISQLKEQFDFVVCDSPAGIEQGAHHAMFFADDAVMTTNPDLSSVRDADKMIGLLTSKSQRAIQKAEPIRQTLLVTRYQPDRVAANMMLSVKDISDMLSIPVLGVVPESEEVISGTNVGQPVILGQGDAGAAYRDAVARFVGERRELQFLTPKSKGFFKRVFG